MRGFQAYVSGGNPNGKDHLQYKKSFPGQVLTPIFCSCFSSVTSRFTSSILHTYLQDDESLKYLTHEEKDVILFFEETLGSLEDDFDEQALCDSGIHCHSPQSLEESPASQSEPEDVIDLVQLGPAAGEAEDLPDGPLGAGEPEYTDSHLV